MKLSRPVLSALGAFVFAMFVGGGIVAAWWSMGNTALLARFALAPRSVPTAQPAPTPQLASNPGLRDFDNSPPPFEPATADQAPIAPSPAGRMTLLLLGSDQRPDEAALQSGDPGRTDSMMLVSIDYDAHTASMVSIPRDGFVVIPGYGSERVNAAYTYGELAKRGGGPALVKQTVSQLFGVPVDRYALVDIHSMEQIIDTLGGVWIDNPTELIDTQYPTDDYRTITIDIPAGRQLMNGQTAVEYARTRHPDSDYGREGRQQQVMLAIRDQALQLNLVPKLPSLMPQLQNLVHTDLSPVEILQLASFGRGLDGKNIVVLKPSAELTPAYTGYGGASYINLTPAYRAQVRLMVTEPLAVAEAAQVRVYNAGAPAGTGSAVAQVLRGAGLGVTDIANAPAQKTSRVEVTPSAVHSGQAILKLLGLPDSDLVTTGESATAGVRVLVGPDVKLPAR